MTRAKDGYFDGYWDDYGWPRKPPKARKPPAPPPPPQPTEAEMQDICGSKLERKNVFHNVRVRTMEDALTAIIVFSRGSLDTENHTLSQMSIEGAYMFLMGRGNGDRFTQRVYDDARRQLEEGRPYSGDWDYDGQGPFFKASFSITPQDADGNMAHRYDHTVPPEKAAYYIVSTHAAYIGSAKEKTLASAMNGLKKPISPETESGAKTAPTAQYGLNYVTITQQFEQKPKALTYSVPIRDLILCIESVLPCKTLSDDDLIGMCRAEYDKSSAVLLAETKSFKLWMEMPHWRIVSLSPHRKTTKPVVIEMKGKRLVGTARRDNNFGLSEGPQVVLRLHHKDGIVYDEYIQTSMLALGERIEQAMK